MIKFLPSIFFAVCLAVSAQEEARNFRIFPHVTDPAGAFQTFLIFENITDEEQTVQLVPYYEEGTQRPVPIETLAPGEVRTLPQEEILGETRESHFFVGSKNFSSEGIRVTLAYALRNGNGSPVYIPEQNTAATRWRFFSGDGIRVFDSFAMVNLGTEATIITIRQLNADGEVLLEISLEEELPVLARRLFVLGAGDSAAFDRSVSNIFEIESTQPMVVMSLQGDLPDSRYLWRNTVYPIDPQQFGLDYQR